MYLEGEVSVRLTKSQEHLIVKTTYIQYESQKINSLYRNLQNFNTKLVNFNLLLK